MMYHDKWAPAKYVCKGDLPNGKRNRMKTGGYVMSAAMIIRCPAAEKQQAEGLTTSSACTAIAFDGAIFS